jgi:hypothetical protein
MYVNLITQNLTIVTRNFSDVNDLYVRTSCKRSHYLFNLRLIFCVINKFSPDQDSGYDLILMQMGGSPFAIFEPTFGRQKDEYKNDNAQSVPLPGVSGVIPKKQFLKEVRQFKPILLNFGDRFSNPQATKQFRSGHSSLHQMSCKSIVCGPYN